eukprot:163561_1
MVTFYFPTYHMNVHIGLCARIKYYIAHNIKYKYLYYNYSTFESDKRYYSSYKILMEPSLPPKQTDNKTYSDKIYQCTECKNDMQVIERFWNVTEGHRSRYECTRHQDYCNKCQLLRTSIQSKYGH